MWRLCGQFNINPLKGKSFMANDTSVHGFISRSVCTGRILDLCIMVELITCIFQIKCVLRASRDIQINSKDSDYHRNALGFLLSQRSMYSLCNNIDSFVLSACAVTHHFLGDSRILFGVKNLFKFHWGSVVAGSFLANFFYLPDILFDLIKPSNTNSPFYSVCCCCDRVFGFVRSEAVGFINMVGLPFCNSSRWCEKINGLSEEF